jgi:glutamine amidotransferase
MSDSSVVIANLGSGNLRSVVNAVQAAGAPDAVISSDPQAIADAERLVLPGQGSFATWMQRFADEPALREAVMSQLEGDRPVLGICVGMQALHAHSAEGEVDGLALLPGQVRRFDAVAGRPVPHMGWNQVKQRRPHPLWYDIDDGAWFYFVHSYYADTAESAEAVGTCDYGVTFTAALARDNVFATQFHPEKSQHAGLQLLRNFLAWDGATQP